MRDEFILQPAYDAPSSLILYPSTPPPYYLPAFIRFAIKGGQASQPCS